MIEHPDITRVNLTGYPKNSNQSYKVIDTVCDVCEYEAVIKFHNTKLCSSCAKEESIELI